MIMNHLRLLVLLLPLLASAPAFAADELCPDIATARAHSPNDMAGVQADIERLTLCVERAKLLKQLDDIATARQVLLDKAKNPTGTISTGLGVAPGMIPALPASALPPLDNSKIEKTGSVTIHQANDSPLDATVASLVAPEWRVRKIWGQGAAMHAQLSDGRGTLINVIKNDPLPDGPIVETVSVKGVAVSQNGKIKDLSWEQAASPEMEKKK